MHLSSDDDTGSDSDDSDSDDPYASQHEEGDEDDGASSDDTVISIRDSVVLRGRLASARLEAERLSQELQVALANMGEFQRDHLRPNQTILDQLIDQLTKEQTAAAGPPTTPARTETQRKAREIAYRRTLAALEKRLKEVRAAHSELKELSLIHI